METIKSFYFLTPICIRYVCLNYYSTFVQKCPVTNFQNPFLNVSYWLINVLLYVIPLVWQFVISMCKGNVTGLKNIQQISQNNSGSPFNYRLCESNWKREWLYRVYYKDELNELN